jgi:hypothetical protein
MPLNEELTWAQVGDIDTGGGGKVRDAFQLIFGEPTKDLLSVGMKLYKFNTYDTICQGEPTPTTPLSPWWTAVEPYKHDGGLVQKLKIAEASGVSGREWGRLTSAIKENWNSMEWVLTIELSESVYGWFGGFKGMGRIQKDTVSKRDRAVEQGFGTKLPGGGTQFYIPNLLYKHISSKKFDPLL